MDCDRDEILEIGAIRLEEQGEPSVYHTLVRPSATPSDTVLTLTGLTAVELSQAPTLESVMPDLLEFLNNSTLCGYNVDFDLRFLLRACDKTGYELSCSRDPLDVLLLAKCLEPGERDFRLGDVAGRNGIFPEQAHRATADAQTTLDLLRKMHDKASRLPYSVLEELTSLAGLFSQTTASWFQACAGERFADKEEDLPANCHSIRGLVFQEPAQDATQSAEADVASAQFAPLADGESLADRALALLQPGGPLATNLPGFEVRTGQQQMVAAVAAALDGDEHLLVEAGTGTGKSLAYLIPAALYAMAHDSKVVIATQTVALQEQIRTRDFPTLRRVLPFPMGLAVFKGRTHYICMRKLHSDLGTLTFTSSRDEIVTYMSLLSWLPNTQTGDREELGLSGLGEDVWPRVQSETETCINKRCPFFKPCYYFRARANAQRADLLVTNHSLIFSDLKTDFRVLPPYEKLVLDEAHHLEEQATKHLGAEVHLRRVQSLFARIVRDSQRQGILPELLAKMSSSGSPSSMEISQWMTDILGKTAALRLDVESAFDALIRLVPGKQNEFRLTAELESAPEWSSYLEALDILEEHWRELEETLVHLAEAAEDEEDEDLSGRMFDLVGFYPEIEKNIEVLRQAADFDDAWVTWVEVRRSSTRVWPSLCRAPLDVAPLLEEKVFNTKSSVVLTSATLSVNKSFQYVKQQLGLENIERDGRLAVAIVDSPFQMDKQALLCIPNDVPDLAPLSDGEAATWLSDSLYQLAKASNGRVLALFTSHGMLRATAKALRSPLAEAGYRTFAQGIDGNRNQLLESFRKHPESVLLGAQTFWEGIDLPGDQLRTLVIVRLPFAPPTHPVTQARYQKLEQQGRSSFVHASLPQAVVRFRQGFGRLIRSTTDKGVVVVFDKRIVTARYGRNFIDSIAGIRPFIGPEEQVVAQIRHFFAPLAPAASH